ncbi:hypothetical protein DW884_18670 [Ruminococcus sp. AM40-10AC]|nr:hypothetical protein DWW20_14915 [Ruminococcus sp. AF14-5]RHT05472.1 hypothetical protein DW884_18670 [Ruminococcus sp. AM40-10AC]
MRELKTKKRTYKISLKKSKKEQIRNPAFHIIVYFSYCKRQPAKRLPDFYKKAKIYRNSGGKNNETF